jgi:hypothetical protein
MKRIAQHTGEDINSVKLRRQSIKAIMMWPTETLKAYTAISHPMLAPFQSSNVTQSRTLRFNLYLAQIYLTTALYLIYFGKDSYRKGDDLREIEKIDQVDIQNVT